MESVAVSIDDAGTEEEPLVPPQDAIVAAGFVQLYCSPKAPLRLCLLDIIALGSTEKRGILLLPLAKGKIPCWEI